jgi:hypothetical protein
MGFGTVRSEHWPGTSGSGSYEANACLAARGKSGVSCVASVTGPNARRSAAFDTGHLRGAATKQVASCCNPRGECPRFRQLVLRVVARLAARGTFATGC